MRTLAKSLYLDSEFDTLQNVPRAGSALENPFVFDATARELKTMAEHGLVEIVHEHQRPVAGGSLIDCMTFKRLR